MTQDQRIGVVMVGFCLFTWVYLIPYGIVGETQAFYPRLVTLFITLPSVLLLLRRKEPERHKIDAQERMALLSLLGVAALYLVYLYSVSVLGFYSSSCLFGVLFMVLFGCRNVPLVLGLPLGLSALVYAVIEYTLHFPLPGGMLF